MTECPRGIERRTYLPVLQDVQLYQKLFERDYEYLSEAIKAKYPYERIGFDRFLAILIDLEMTRIYPPASVLDIGCNVGLFSLGLSTMGYNVVGVDSNIAADVQGSYPENVVDIACSLQNELEIENLKFVRADVEDFLESNPGQFEVCLLLSVVHQWFAGYASSGIGRKSQLEIEETLRRLVSHIDRVIYYERPEEEGIIQDMNISLPGWFLGTSLAEHVIPIATSIAANGQLRTLYRIEL
jgi:SAM-dependent methyltransferase